ncbi:hypothetical protein GCM10018781_64220 [Kitasatospora indigofera]|uniref:Uncharacterized protein n=1 Tax=Kitasatospora indigofera TaxID=67307 RepID=A0A919GB05_9ACTN|nr:hypothetical protein GCM10018781_64220 [Kitasatospora indigofera]
MRAPYAALGTRPDGIRSLYRAGRHDDLLALNESHHLGTPLLRSQPSFLDVRTSPNRPGLSAAPGPVGAGHAGRTSVLVRGPADGALRPPVGPQPTRSVVGVQVPTPTTGTGLFGTAVTHRRRIAVAPRTGGGRLPTTGQPKVTARRDLL